MSNKNQHCSFCGKPKDESDAFRMLSALSGKTHEVYTGVCILFMKNGERIRGNMHKRRYIHLPYIKRILFFWIAGFIFGSTLGVFFLPQYKEQYLYIQKQLYTKNEIRQILWIHS